MASENAGKETTTENPAVKAAEERAKAAEKRAKDLEAANAKREADAEAAKKKSEADSLEGAKKQLAEIEAREKAAQERIAAFEKKEQERVDARLALLPDDVKASVTKFKDKLSLEDFSELVEDELQRASGSDDKGQDGMPTIMTPGGRNKPAPGERALHPKTEEILDKINVDTRMAKSAVIVEYDGNDRTKGKFSMPVKSLINALKERAKMPMRLTDDHMQKLVDVAKRSRNR